MLKRLELVGFKSFAEKTRFDFPPGVTAIVGPNGSGKSNVVDAVRWILGEQSAKSLRGGEMADVIFNGSSSRKSLGLAEVTMTFDNQRRTLATDAEEVQITRRVYRDGTGEYLINNQIARLKDIKELFLGSGAGAGAYCIIEQGRVDALLQASTRDRRVIFEEAAGISRVKAKKLETLRKLERVEQNLQRLNDVLGEVNKQLGRLRLDASKARRYEEYSARLRELRVGLGLREYHQLTGQLRAESEALAGLRSGLSEAQLQAEAWEAEAGRLEQTLARVEALLAEESARLAAVWQQITTQESALSHERSKVAELDAELAETRRKWVTLAYHVRELEDSTARTREEVAEVAAQAEGQRQRVEELAAGLAATDASLAELGRQVQADRVAQVDLVRQAGTLQTQADGLRAQLERQQRDLGQRRARVSQKATELASLDAMLDHLSQADADLQHRIGGARQSLGERVREREGLRQQAEAFQQTLGDLQVRRSDLCGRIDVLEGLERSQEGLGTGVREVMQLLEAERAGERSTADARLSEVVLGLVADFLTVPREVAPLIDLALGDAAQRFVVRDADRLDAALRARAEPFGGRVGFVPAGEPSRVRNAECGVRNEKTIPPSEVPAQAGSLFRIPHSALRTREGSPAAAWVTCDHPELAALPWQLLGTTLIVPDLETARRIASGPDGAGFRFVTRQGELLEADGTLTVGTHHAEAGILSRKSELRELRLQAAELERQIADAESRLAGLREQIDALEVPVRSLEQEIHLLTGQAGDLQTQIVQHREHRTRLDDEITLFRSEMQVLEQEIQGLAVAWNDARRRAEEAERAAQALMARLEEADRTIRATELRRQQEHQEHTAAQVALAQTDERLSGLRAKLARAEEELQRQQREADQTAHHGAALRARLDECRLATLQASAVLARCSLDKEAGERRVGELAGQRDRDRERRRVLGERLHGARSASQEQVEQVHAREMAVRDLEHRRATLTERLREDYQIDLGVEYENCKAEEPLPPPHPPLPRGGEGGVQDSIAPRETSEALRENGDVEDPPERTNLEHPPPRLGGGVDGVGGEVCDLPPWNVSEVNAEIDSLRDKIRRLGSVNMESLQELAEVEGRAKELQTQYDDLTSAQASLQEIIAKINADSRKLFSDAYENIRSHFQELFRKLFGGGMADIVLEDPNDVLESGIEVVARPPGKELRSISLMSGGEKTMTAVALLLAIFRSKPSPFCLLDEVDAALDEANTARLAAVLRDFTDRSQFIIITHKKRTMAAADVLFGITMQESGVSKQVTVRFEDWPEEEQPRAAA